MTTTASNPSADKVHQIQATTTPEGEVRFALPIKPEFIESVEAIDLDLMLTTTSGEKYIMQQGALLATINTESKLVFSNGDAMSAADQMKRMGVMKPVEASSFRLASALTPEMAEKVTGNEFGLGKDAQDTVAKIEKIIQSLESATQSSQSSESNSAQGLGKNSAFKSNADPLASPAAGAPPKTDSDSVSNVKVNDTVRSFNGSSDASFDGLLIKSAGTTVYDPNRQLKQVDLTQINVDKIIQVDLHNQTTVDLSKNQGTLTLPGVLNATKLELVLASGTPPKEFTINSKKFVGGKIVISDVQSLVDLKLQVDWDPKSATSQATVFEIGATFFNGSTKLDYGNTALNFEYDDTLPESTLDGNGNLKIFLSESGYSYNVTGTGNNDNIKAGSGNDTLKGGAGDDVLIGGTGADKLYGGIESDTASGSAGSDTASYETAAARILGTGVSVTGVVASLSAPSSNEGDAKDDTYFSIENLTGSSFNDKLTGDDNANILIGGAGDDFLIGGAGADTLNGGINADGTSGSDTASYETAAARILGTGVSVTGVVASLSAPSSNEGDAKDDTYFSIENLTGSKFDDKLTGNSGSNTLDGGEGNDTVSYAHVTTATITATLGTNGSDGSATGDGVDVLRNIESLIGGSRNDSLTGNEKNNTLNGADGADTLKGGAGDDILIGGKGADKLYGGIESDTASGSAGSDTASYESAEARTLGTGVTVTGVVASLITPSSNEGDAKDDTYFSIENLTGSKFDDKLTGNSGSNTLDGGEGNDTVSYAHVTTATITATLGTNGSDGSATGDGVDVLRNIESLIGGSRNDSLTGNEKNNTLNGADGADTLKGGAGDDILIGGKGADKLYGGIESDTASGSAGSDTASYESAEARTLGTGVTVTGVVASLITPSSNEGDAKDDTYFSIENLTGSKFDDKLIGDSNNNIIKGGVGNDILIGGVGAVDTLDGGAGTDTASYETATAQVVGTNGATVEGVIASLADSSKNEGDAKGDTYTSIENLTGSAFNDKLSGDANDNILVGGNGNDTLIGGAGNDTLDLKTNNSELHNDSVNGDTGSDTIVISQSQLVSSEELEAESISGGENSDTLQFHASAAGELNLIDIFGTNKLSALSSFESLDLSKDSIASKAVISSSFIQGLVDNDNSSNLTLVLSKTNGAVDSYTIAAGENYSIGQNASNQTVFTFQNAANTQIAQLTISYV